MSKLIQALEETPNLANRALVLLLQDPENVNKIRSWIAEQSQYDIRFEALAKKADIPINMPYTTLKYDYTNDHPWIPTILPGIEKKTISHVRKSEIGDGEVIFYLTDGSHVSVVPIISDDPDGICDGLKVELFK